MIRSLVLLTAVLALTGMRTTPETDAATLRSLHDAALTRARCYDWLRELCKDVGARLSGSPQAAQAVEWGEKTLRSIGLDSVWKQDVMVPHWVRGKTESATAYSRRGKQALRVTALGGSVGTGPKGIRAQVIEVHSLAEVAALSPEQVKGKIVFYNRPMDPKHIDTFDAYGGCVDQRSRGAMEAAKPGALAVLVRSMTLEHDIHPHTGAMRYAEGGGKIPAAAIATEDADRLAALLKADPATQVHLRLDCETLPDAPSHNVIGEIRGSEFPDEIIVVGGHLDSWDKGEGAHDDGAGIVQSMEVLHLMRELGLRPKRTIRAVLFMNEENGMRGGLKYAEIAKATGEKHIAALESDRGGFSPRGFEIDGDSSRVQYIQQWRPLLQPYKLLEIIPGYGGVDIGPLKETGTLLIGLTPDSQRYFDFHHAHTDVFEAVNKRELELGAAAMACMVWLLSEHGVPAPAPH